MITLQLTLKSLASVNSKQKSLYAWLDKAKLTDIHSVREAKERINRILELEIQKELLLDLAAKQAVLSKGEI